jgi:hypothetical protein
MPLQIRQGVQPTFDILIDENVVMKIIKLELNPKNQGSIIVSFQIMTGKYKGEILKDYVDYDPTSKLAWRYQNLRKAAGVPYTKDEPESIDIERLLLNQAVSANLSRREYKDKTTGVDKAAQQIDYLEESNITEEELETIQDEIEAKEKADEQSLPFSKKDPEPVGSTVSDAAPSKPEDVAPKKESEGIGESMSITEEEIPGQDKPENDWPWE